MKRRDFVHTLSAAAAGGLLAPRPRVVFPKKLQRIGLELYAVRRAMAKDPDGTLAAVRAAGYSDVELLWSFGNFGRSTAQVVAALKQNGLRAPSAHVSPVILFIGWQRSLDTAKELGHEYLIVPDFGDSVKTLDDWREWADHFNTAGAVARKAGIWLAFHNEADHMKPMEGQVPYDVFVNRLDPAVTRLQLDVGNMLIGGGDPMQYLEKYKSRYWSFHLKDVVQDRSSDTRLGQGIFDFKRFLAAVPNLDQKPAYVEDESPADEMAAARSNVQYLQNLEF
ncbi:MAG TPA: sugar phosphate isomerase/epimerase [Gemmatimonadales bacterium]|jgi:sugar phosphate isomerase/epimerase|nr:sugar phosphate isomerase/epimerase [Gemmatimonadales bacterium]